MYFSATTISSLVIILTSTVLAAPLPAPEPVRGWDTVRTAFKGQSGTAVGAAIDTAVKFNKEQGQINRANAIQASGAVAREAATRMLAEQRQKDAASKAAGAKALQDAQKQGRDARAAGPIGSTGTPAFQQAVARLRGGVRRRDLSFTLEQLD